MADRKLKTPEKMANDSSLELPSNKTESTSPASGEESLLHDNPDYIDPSRQDFLLLDVTPTSKILHSKISAELGVNYLSAATDHQSSPLFGCLYGLNKRLIEVPPPGLLPRRLPPPHSDASIIRRLLLPPERSLFRTSGVFQ